jgi:hypothetical protein
MEYSNINKNTPLGESPDSTPGLQRGVFNAEFATHQKNPSAIIPFKADLFRRFGILLFPD